MPGRLAVVTAPGEIDETTVHWLGRVLLAAAASGHDIVVVDMTRSRFCDCAGIGVLVRAHKRAVVAGGELRLLPPAEGMIPRLFTLTGLHRAIPVFASMQDALSLSPSAEDGREAPGTWPTGRHAALRTSVD